MRDGCGGKVSSESGTGSGELLQRSQSVTQHDMPVNAVAGLVECAETLNINRIQFKELLNAALGNFGSAVVHLVGGTEQRQQIEPGASRRVLRSAGMHAGER